jgi:phage protein D
VLDEGGDIKGTVALQDRGTKQAITGASASAKTAEAAGARTHRLPIAGQKSGTDGAHAEDIPAGWTNVATQLSRRKDTASLVLDLTPDLYLTHAITLEGWGGKCDGTWYPESIKHSIIGAAAASTSVSIHRKGSTAGANAAGVVAFG